nr:hypothetical protein [Pseudenhygromyxa sp. WMMC2535]
MDCGVTLPQLVDDEPRRHQLLELEPSGPHVTEFRRHEVACSRCGGRTRVSCREAKIPASSFGPRLVAVVVMLTGVYLLLAPRHAGLQRGRSRNWQDTQTSRRRSATCI